MYTVLAGLVCLLLAAPGCTPRAHAPLRIGINAEPGYEFAYLAQVIGGYAEEGVEVRLVQFASMGDSRRAYERGQLDGYFGTVIEVVQARANSSRSPRIVRVLDRSLGFDVVLAANTVAGLDSLRGRRVAVEPGSLNAYLLARGLARHGLGLGDVRLVDMDPGAMRTALVRHDVDAVVTYPPVATQIVGAGIARSVFSSAEIPGEIVDVLAIDEGVTRSRPRDVEGLLRGYDGAVAWMAGHPDSACAIMAAREGLSPAEFHSALTQGLELVSASAQEAYFATDGLLPRVIRASSDVLVQTGQIDRPVEAADVLPERRGR